MRPRAKDGRARCGKRDLVRQTARPSHAVEFSPLSVSSTIRCRIKRNKVLVGREDARWVRNVTLRGPRKRILKRGAYLPPCGRSSRSMSGNLDDDNVHPRSTQGQHQKSTYPAASQRKQGKRGQCVGILTTRATGQITGRAGACRRSQQRAPSQYHAILDRDLTEVTCEAHKARQESPVEAWHCPNCA